MNSSMQELLYTQLWNEHVQSIRNFCYAKLKGRPEDAEDMLQDAFGLLWQKIKFTILIMLHVQFCGIKKKGCEVVWGTLTR